MHSMADVATKDIFDFFGLARELRDLIYAQLCKETKHVKKGTIPNANAFITRCPPLSALLVSRQFSEELRSCSAKISVLTIEDQFNGDGPLELPIPLTLLGVCNVHFNLFCPCYPDGYEIYAEHICGSAAETDRHHKRIEHVVAQMPALRCLSVRIHLDEGDGPSCREIVKKASSKLVEIRQLVKLEAFHVDDKGWGAGEYEYTTSERRIMEWDAKAREMV